MPSGFELISRVSHIIIMPRRSQASTHSGVGMLCDVRTALPPMSFSTPTPIPLQPVGKRRAHARVVLMVAGAFDLHRLAVEEESLVGVPRDRAHAKADALGVARLPAGLDRDHRRVKVRSFRRPQRGIRDVALRRESCRAVGSDGLRRGIRRRDDFSRRHQESASARGNSPLAVPRSARLSPDSASPHSLHGSSNVLSQCPRCSASVFVSHTCR